MSERLEGGLLKNGLALFGDNAYLNTHYMATPFPNISSGYKDDYIFPFSGLYSSRVCIWNTCFKVGNFEKCHSMQHNHCEDNCLSKLSGKVA